MNTASCVGVPASRSVEDVLNAFIRLAPWERQAVLDTAFRVHGWTPFLLEQAKERIPEPVCFECDTELECPICSRDYKD